jgi:hypothetical protein
MDSAVYSEALYYLPLICFVKADVCEDSANSCNRRNKDLPATQKTSEEMKLFPSCCKMLLVSTHLFVSRSSFAWSLYVDRVSSNLIWVSDNVPTTFCSVFFLREESSLMRTLCFLCVLPLQLFKLVDRLNETRCQYYAIGVQPEAIIFNFLHSITTTWWTSEFGVW